MKYTYSSDWIHQHENLFHWTYYWHQIRLVRKMIDPEDSILEIGVGTRFTSDYLKSKGYSLKTLDIDPAKRPDIVGNIVEMNLPETYDDILAFEVFEHIPFQEFVHVLQKLKLHCRKRLVISVPRNEKFWFSIRVELPGRKAYGFRITTRRNKIISERHHWEVDHPPVSRKVLEQAFQSAKFEIEEIKKVDSLYFYVLINR